MNSIKYIFLLIAVMMFTLVIHGQTSFIAQDQYNNRLTANIGFEPSLILKARYDRLISTPLPMRIALFAGGEATYYRKLNDHINWSTGARVLLVEKGVFNLTYETGIQNGRLSTRLFYARKWQWDNQLEAGFYGRKAGISLITGYHQNLGLHLEHTDFYREAIYENARDGWYKGAGGYLDIGVTGQFLLMNRIDITLTAKSSYTSKAYPLNILPLQMILGVGYRL